MRNLVKIIEEEALQGYLTNWELWIFTDNLAAKSCMFRGGSSSKLLHELVLWLQRDKPSARFVLHMIHVTGMRIIAQGTHGLSRGTVLEGVVTGQDMLLFKNLSNTCREL